MHLVGADVFQPEPIRRMAEISTELRNRVDVRLLGRRRQIADCHILDHPTTQRAHLGHPDSRVLLTKDGFIQGYNAQAAVDGAKQIIVAHGLTQSMSDCPQLVPLVDAVRANLGRKPREISADAGYCSEDNLLALATRKIHAYVATGRAKHPAGATRKVGGEMTQKIRQKLKRPVIAAGTDCESR